MISTELFILSALRGIVEMVMLVLLGQGILALLAGARRANNPIYMLFDVITRPVIRLVRFISPKVIMDKHIPFVAFFILFWLWIFLAYAKRLLGG